MQFLKPEIWSLSGDPEAIVHNIGRIDSDGGTGMPGLWNLGEPRFGSSWISGQILDTSQGGRVEHPVNQPHRTVLLIV